MQIERLRLRNWQCYRGADGAPVDFDFRGKTSGQCNAIIYGQNTRGKTAFWESVRFALYGQVPKRMANPELAIMKPFTAPSKDQEPLLSHQARLAGDYTFAVEIWFTHGATAYHLSRRCQPRQGVEVPNSTADYIESLQVLNHDSGAIVQDATSFVDEILPEELVQFFMFDGERIEEYRKLFQNHHDVELRAYIEAILRLPVLRDGAEDFRDLATKLQREISKLEREQTSNKRLKKEIEQLEAELDSFKRQRATYLEEKKKWEEVRSEARSWLANNDRTKQAVEQQDRYRSDLHRLENEIKSEKARIRRALPGSWRAILTPDLDRSIKQTEAELDRQTRQSERIGEYSSALATLQSQLGGRECATCKRPFAPPTGDAKAEITRQILKLEQEIASLQSARLTPNPTELHDKLRKLLRLRSDLRFDELVESEHRILRASLDQTRVGQLLKQAEALDGADKHREVQEHIQRWEAANGKLGALDARVNALDNEADATRAQLAQKSRSIRSTTATPLLRKLDRAHRLALALEQVWRRTLVQHRGAMRRRVEEQASRVFMQCTNNADNYQGLEITDDFTIRIINKAGDRDLGSPGQWAIVAYSMLDALTAASGIEFPMVVDTPGRSIDNKHLENVYAHFMNSGRQVIFLPEGKELDPTEGDERYGHLCAATYQLSKRSDDSTDVCVRVNNLRGGD